MGFEPMRGFTRLYTFQAYLFSLLSNSPNRSKTFQNILYHIIIINVKLNSSNQEKLSDCSRIMMCLYVHHVWLDFMKIFCCKISPSIYFLFYSSLYHASCKTTFYPHNFEELNSRKNSPILSRKSKEFYEKILSEYMYCTAYFLKMAQIKIK